MAGSMIAPIAGALVIEATRRGVPIEALLEALGLAGAAQLADFELRIPADRIFAAWEIALRTTKDDALPIDVGMHASVARFGVLGYALSTCATFDDGVAVLARYHNIINDSGRWHLERGEVSSTTVWDRTPSRLGARVANEQALASMVKFTGEAYGDTLPIVEVRFAHAAPAQTARHDAYFAAPIVWNAPHTAIVFRNELFARRPVLADPTLASQFRAAADRALARIAPADSWVARVSRIVSDQLANGLPTLEAVAKSLGVSERTARRRLADENVAYGDLVETVQRERAAELLAGPMLARDIAFALGFSDATAFSRAYKRWTGRTPSEARAKR